MILQYFKSNENIDKEEAKLLYITVIKLSKLIITKNIDKIENNFNSSFEITSLLLISIFFGSKKLSFKYKNVNQEIMNLFISDIDNSLRLSGVSDMKIGKKVKLYLKKFYFRVSKLESIFNANDTNNFYLLIDEIYKKNI